MRFDKTRADGFTPRFLARHEVIDRITMDAQTSQGFDQLKLPLCSASDRTLFHGFQNHRDEKPWNDECGVKSQFKGLDMGLTGTVIQSAIDSPLPEPLATSTGICNRNRLPSLPKFHLSANATYTVPLPGGRQHRPAAHLRDDRAADVLTSLKHVTPAKAGVSRRQKRPLQRNPVFAGMT